MKAVRVAEWGVAPHVEDVSDPVARPGYTTVRVEAATVGHIDRTIWAGQFLRPPARPYTPGVEAAGVVVASEAFAPGDRVWVRGGGLGTAVDGTWAEFVAAPDESLGPLPDEVPFTLGSAFFSPCTSGWIAVHAIGEVVAGQQVVVTGASGAVGAMATQLATEAGAEVIGTVSRAERLDLLPAGVWGVVVDGPESVADIEADVLIDTVGGGVLSTVLPLVRPGGRAVLVGYLAGPTLTLDIAAFLQRNVSLLPLNMLHREPEGRRAAPELLRRLGDGRLTLDVETFPLDQAAAALDWLVGPNHRGRAVLVPSSDASDSNPTISEEAPTP